MQHKFIYLLLLIISLVIFFIINIANISKTNINNKTRYYYDYTENTLWNPINHIQLINNDNNIIYLYWTGGYDSTYRLIELMLLNKYIQPIYLLCPQLDSNYTFQRKNKNIEIKTMNKIRQQLYLQFPTKKQYLLPTRYIYSLKLNKQIETDFIYITTKLFNFSRGITQYERLTQYSYFHSQPIEIGLEKCGTGLDKLTSKYRIGQGHNRKVDLINSPKQYYVFKNIRFPISHMTKQDMLLKCQQNKTDNIMKLTWRCWFPVNNNPCKKCDMCKHRII